MKNNVPFLIVLAAAGTMAMPLLAEDAATTPAASQAPAFDRKVNLVYTVNNLGYTDTCG